MADLLTVDLFAEDMAHEEFIRPLILRIAREVGKPLHVRVRSARGGHGRVIAELKAYQRSVVDGMSGGIPNLLVAAVDANRAGFSATREEIEKALLDEFRHVCIPACPDPHIERWYLADLQAFHSVVGITPNAPSDRRGRDFYKAVLAHAVVEAGHPATLGGVEFAAELAETMDFYRAGRSESSLRHFTGELQGMLVQL